MSLWLVGAMILAGMLLLVLILCALAVDGTDREEKDNRAPKPKQLSFWD